MKQNIPYIVQKNRERRIRNRDYSKKLKEGIPCTDCGVIYHHSVMQYDHIMSGKTLNISRLVNHGYSIKRIDAEIALCELVCANCHSYRTWNRNIKAK